MKTYEDLSFQLIIEDDIDILSPIMKRSFDNDAQIHLNQPEGGPPGYDNGDFLKKYALDPNSTAYKVSKNGHTIGAFIIWIGEDQQNFLGNIFIDPAMQNKGLGHKIWRFIESQYPETAIWRTETPGFSKRNHNFYVNKCGFSIIKIENKNDKYEEKFVMEKIMENSLQYTSLS